MDGKVESHSGSNGFTWDVGDHRVVVNFDYHVWTLGFYPDGYHADTQQLVVLNWEWAT